MHSTTKSILLIISGSIAAYKSLSLIRLLRQQGHSVRCILSKGAAQFITPLSVAAISENPCYQQLFDLKDETEMGHIRLVREADMVLVAPASANLIAKMAHGLADDLASACLLAAGSVPVAIAPAMNMQMWAHPATQANCAQLRARAVNIIAPDSGALACGEVGQGRMQEPEMIATWVQDFFAQAALSGAALRGKKALVTAGPTFEAIDPVRYIANRSSGRQGYALAAALAAQGAQVTLVSGPTALECPAGVKRIQIESAAQMLQACLQTLPCDIAVMSAAVADWSIASSTQKLKKDQGGAPKLELRENPDILAQICAHSLRPALVIGFAAETQSTEKQLIATAQAKRLRKGCDWIFANDVSLGTQTFGGAQNAGYLIDAQHVIALPEMDKTRLAADLVARIAQHFDTNQTPQS